MDQKLEIILSAKDLTQRAFTSASARVQKFTSNVFSMRGVLVATAGVAAMGAFVKKSMETADAIGKAADAIGISTGTLQEYRHAARISGVATESLDKSIGQFTKRVGEARAGTGAMITFLKLFDTQLLSNIQNSRSTDEALDLVFKRMGQTASATDKAALANAAFGRSGITMVNMVKDGAAGLAKLRQEARDLGIVMDDHLIRNSERANDEIEKLTRVMKVQFMSAAVGLAPEIARIAQNTTDWWKANQALVKTEVAEYANKIKNALVKIWEVISYDPAILEWGLVGLAIGGKKWGVIAAGMGHMATWSGNLAKALGLASQGILEYSEIAKANFAELEAMVKKGESLLAGQTTGKIGPDTKGYEIYQPPAPTPGPPAPGGGDDKAALAEYKSLMKEVEKAQAEFQAALVIPQGTGATVDEQLRRDVGKYTAGFDQTQEDIEKSKEAYAAMFEDLKFQSADYYAWKKEQLTAQADAYAESTGQRLLSEQWLNEQLKELDAERLAAQEETSQFLIDLSERTSDAIEDTFSDLVYDLKDGWKDWQSYFSKLSDSLWRITSDIVGQMIKEWLFGTAKTTAALATEGAQVGVLTQLYWLLAAAKAAAGMGGGMNTGAPTHVGAGGTTAFGMAGGGDVEKDKIYLIGEKGPEIFVPTGSGTIIPNQNIRNMATSESKNVTIHNSISIGRADERTASLLLMQIEDVTRRVLREEMR